MHYLSSLRIPRHFRNHVYNIPATTNMQITTKWPLQATWNDHTQSRQKLININRSSVHNWRAVSVCHGSHSLLCENIKVHCLLLQRNKVLHFRLMSYLKKKGKGIHMLSIILLKFIFEPFGEKHYLGTEKPVILKSNCA